MVRCKLTVIAEVARNPENVKLYRYTKDVIFPVYPFSDMEIELYPEGINDVVDSVSFNPALGVVNVLVESAHDNMPYFAEWNESLMQAGFQREEIFKVGK